ncbi:MAG: LON peptidase substrate-binding domain-containing protein, partial [Actinobacteria bacterium]|nr:LON peptidase substrate-binding domain-containing protein [Actinomycetota bacterium]
MSQVTTRQFPVVPLDTGVVLPHMVVTVGLEPDEARSAIEAAEAGDGLVLLVPRTNGRYGRIGTVAKLEDRGELPSGDVAAVVRGLHRAVIETGVAGTGGALWVRADAAPDPDVASERAQELAREYRALVETIIEARGGRAAAEFLRGITNPGHMADMSGYSPVLSYEQKLEVLETLDVEERLTKLVAWAKEDLAELSLKEKIRKDVSEGMEKTQREFLLRQQLAAIQKELGEGEGDVVEEYRSKIQEAGMPEDVRKEVERELGRLERTSDQNPEHGWIRNYLDWMVELPWNVRSDDQFDIAEARRILDEDHTGLEDVKDRIVEFLAVKKLRQERGIADAGGRGSG